MRDQNHLDALRHSAAHLLAAAVMELYPGTKRTIGPSIENGFYYDFEFAEPIADADLKKIEKQMKKIIHTWGEGFVHREVTPDEARREYADNPYKLELIDQFAREGQNLTFYKSGSYEDLCRGGHCEHPKEELKYFKLMSLAGAYWRGDEKNAMLTRIYGTAFSTQAELDAYLHMLEEAKKRDHRKLGKELGLFAFSDLVGPGLPLFTPKGATIRRLLEEYVWDLMRPFGYERVDIPHMAKADLYKTSGHWDKFTDDIFHVSSKKSDEQFVMKPMNCPHHTQIYASEQRSYRDLPLRFSEVTKVYRDENTGQLQGLSRVRSITQDDAHVFCRIDQVKDEARAIYQIVQAFYKTFNMPLDSRLSLSDPGQPDKYLGERSVWETSEGMLRELLQEFGVAFEEVQGEAAFYGPKIDFVAKDAIGRPWQLATIQLDFNLPERFQLEYVDEHGEKVRPVMVHRAISGSLERFMGVLIEHYAGAFPLWIAPVQVRVASVSEAHKDAVSQLVQDLKAAGVRAEADVSDATVGAKIRNASKIKIPYTIIFGDKELSGEPLKIRAFGSDDEQTITQADFATHILATSTKQRGV